MMAELKLNLDGEVEALERIKKAADEALKSLEALQGASHGGIHVEMVGDVCRIDIKPAKFNGGIDALVNDDGTLNERLAYAIRMTFDIERK
jgi:hypothetical protein